MSTLGSLPLPRCARTRVPLAMNPMDPGDVTDRHDLRHLVALRDIATAVGAKLGLPSALAAIIERVCALLDCERASLFVIDDDGAMASLIMVRGARQRTALAVDSSDAHRHPWVVQKKNYFALCVPTTKLGSASEERPHGEQR